MKTRPGDERGFVLVGAVMVVLALTIIGLSLFSLSSFESQFLRRSVDQESAFYAATGAMERVRFNLARSGRLEHSWFGFPEGAVDSARAWQWKSGVMVESGPIDPGIVHVRVHARVREAVQTVSGSFAVNVTNNNYRRLFTIGGNVSVNVSAPDFSPGTVRLEGAVYESSAASGWVGLLQSPAPDSIFHGLAWVQPPAVQPLFDANYASTQAATLIPGVNPTWTFDANGQQPGFFRTPYDPYNVPGSGFSFSYLGGASTFGVRGPAVWLAPQGVRAFTEVTIDRLPGGVDDCLIIVAGINAGVQYPGYGVVFEHGLRNPENVPIIIVSPGRVMLRRGTDANPPRVLNYLTVYSGGIEVAGFQTFTQTYRHPVGDPNDLPGGLVDRLLSWGALPGGTLNTSSQLQLIAGSWQESRN